MLNTKDEKVKKALQLIHESLQNKAKKGGSRSLDEIVLENRIFAILCSDYGMPPGKVARIVMEKYGQYLTGDEIIQIFRSRHMSNPYERKELFQWAANMTKLFMEAMQGSREKLEQFYKARRTPALKNGRWHKSQERLAVIMIYTKYPEIDIFNDVESLYVLGNTLAKYFSYDMAEAVREAYGYPQYRDTKKSQPDNGQRKLSYGEALRRVEYLENSLNRTNIMLHDLQDEFEEQLEESRVKELAEFFAQLNSDKYGCILDELLVVRKGVDELRKNRFELPLEINGLLIMVKKLIQFVRDSHIEPIMRINSIREVIAADIEFCNYEGTPFASAEDKKRVRVVSPGWVYKDKEVQISRPKVKEEV